MSEGAQLELVREEREGATIIHAYGEVDLTNADELQQALENPGASTVILDLSEIRYLDSSGIRALDRAYRRLGTEGRSLVVVTPEDTAAGWTFKVAGFDRRLVRSTLEAALAPAAERR